MPGLCYSSSCGLPCRARASEQLGLPARLRAIRAHGAPPPHQAATRRAPALAPVRRAVGRAAAQLLPAAGRSLRPAAPARRLSDRRRQYAHQRGVLQVGASVERSRRPVGRGPSADAPRAGARHGPHAASCGRWAQPTIHPLPLCLLHPRSTHLAALSLPSVPMASPSRQAAAPTALPHTRGPSPAARTPYKWPSALSSRPPGSPRDLGAGAAARALLARAPPRETRTRHRVRRPQHLARVR